MGTGNSAYPMSASSRILPLLPPAPPSLSLAFQSCRPRPQKHQHSPEKQGSHSLTILSPPITEPNFSCHLHPLTQGPAGGEGNVKGHSRSLQVLALRVSTSSNPAPEEPGSPTLSRQALPSRLGQLSPSSLMGLRQQPITWLPASKYPPPCNQINLPKSQL